MFYILPKRLGVVNSVSVGPLELKAEMKYNWKIELSNRRKFYMSYTKYGEGPVSSEARAEIEIMAKIDYLLKELESGSVPEERRKKMVGETKRAISRYDRLFGGLGEDAKEMVKNYSERLKKIE